MNRVVQLALLGLGVLILAGFVARLNLSGIGAAVAHADPVRLGLAVLLLALNVGVKAMRWQIMTGRMRNGPLGLPAAGAAILAGVAAASLTPGRTLELAKPLLLRASHGVPMASSAAAVVVERLLDGAALGVLFAASLALVPAARGAAFYPVFVTLALFLAAGAAVLLLPRRLASATAWTAAHLPLPGGARQRIASVGVRFTAALAGWREGPMLGLLLALSVAAAFVEVLRFSAVLTALGVQVGLPDAMLAFCAANLLAAVTFIPGGIGVTELSLAGIVTLVSGAGPAAAVGAAVLVDRTLSYYLLVATGGLILLAASRRPPTAGGRGSESGARQAGTRYR